MTSSRAALLLLCALAGVESFGYFVPGSVSGGNPTPAPSLPDNPVCDGSDAENDAYYYYDLSVRCEPASGCYWDFATHECTVDPFAMYNGNQGDCESAGGSYAETGAAAGVCSSDPCMAYNTGEVEDVIMSCNYDLGEPCTFMPASEDGYCRTDLCSDYVFRGECLSDIFMLGLSCAWSDSTADTGGDDPAAPGDDMYYGVDDPSAPGDDFNDYYYAGDECTLCCHTNYTYMYMNYTS